MKKLSFIPFLLLVVPILLIGQDTGIQLRIEPEQLQLKVGETAQLNVMVEDEEGNSLPTGKVYFYSRKGRAATVDTTGLVTASSPGEVSIIVLKMYEGKRVRFDVPVTVEHPPIARIDIIDAPSTTYSGITSSIQVKVFDELNFERKGLELSFSTNDPKIASFDSFNNLTAHQEGKVTLKASIGDIKTEQTINVKANKVRRLELSASADAVRTGDVVHYKVIAFDASGKVIPDMPVSFSFSGKSSDVMEFASGLMEEDGRFVPYQAGMYTITASCGPTSTRKVLKATSRQDEIKRKIEFVGQGGVQNKHTSDLWVWEGVDGRDYAVTGTWGADGEAFFWDVTDPANITPIDTIKVDARTVNDVKVSEDGRICVISREGASDRKNGIYILDVSNPGDVRVISEYRDELTGGVHNLFIYKNHVFALSNGERYDIINIEDPAHPQRVGRFELDEPGHSIHDVWVHDGIAYSSNWHDGVVVVDVGNGVAGGSVSNPVKIGSYAYPSGWNHAAFPYIDKATGKFYIIAGDEAFPDGLNIGKPIIAAGWLHVIDFTDPKSPKEVAKYEVPGAGSHNFWIEDNVLYVAYYNAGLRVVDISGELLGDLRKQGREIGHYLPHDPKGHVPNAAMTWGPQPHKGHIFFSDHNSGLWSVKFKEEPVTN